MIRARYVKALDKITVLDDTGLCHYLTPTQAEHLQSELAIALNHTRRGTELKW